jgi:hypothetical protein
MARRNFDNNNPDTDETVVLDFADAVKRIKASRNRTFFMRVQTYAPVKGEADKVFNLTSHIKVNAATALEALESMYGKRFKDEARVQLHIFKNSMFIG